LNPIYWLPVVLAEVPPEEEEPTWLDAFIDGFIDGVFGPLFCALKRFDCWAMEQTLDWGVTAIEALLALLPDLSGHEDGIVDFISWLLLANAWLPLDFAFNAMLGYFTFVVAVVVLKWVLKLIPFIG